MGLPAHIPHAHFRTIRAVGARHYVIIFNRDHLMKLRKSTLLPLVLLVYLAVMSYIGRGELSAGNYLYYFGIIGVTLVCIMLLRLTLRQRELHRSHMSRRRRREKALRDSRSDDEPESA